MRRRSNRSGSKSISRISEINTIMSYKCSDQQNIMRLFSRSAWGSSRVLRLRRHHTQHVHRIPQEPKLP